MVGGSTEISIKPTPLLRTGRDSSSIYKLSKIICIQNLQK